MTEDQNKHGRDEHAEAFERTHIANLARALLGLPARHWLGVGAYKLKEPLPAYAQKAIAFRAAIYGWANDRVRHMLQRNEHLRAFHAMENAQ